MARPEEKAFVEACGPRSTGGENVGVEGYCCRARGGCCVSRRRLRWRWRWRWQGPSAAELLHLSGALGLVRQGGQGLLGAEPRRLQHLAQHAALRRRRAAPATRAPPRRQGQLDRPHRHGRRSGPPSSPRPTGSSRGPAIARRRSCEGTLPVPIETATYKGRLWGAPAQLQHPAALVPQGPGAEPAQDLGRDASAGQRPGQAGQAALHRGPGRASTRA